MERFQLCVPSAYVVGFAMEVAIARESPTLEPKDLLAGLYMASARRVSKYWNRSSAFGRLVNGQPGIREIISAYRKGKFPSPADREQIKLRRGFVPFSPDTARIIEIARHFGASRPGDAVAQAPVVAPEDLLLALAKHRDLDIGHRLLASGLDVSRLEKAVRTLKPRPA